MATNLSYFLLLISILTDMFGEKNLIGQATYPLNCLRSGYRSVPLRNKYSEELELAALLVHVNIKQIKDQY